MADAWNRAEKQSKSISMRKPCLLIYTFYIGIFEDEAAAYTTLLQFSEFYKTTGGRVPVWASWKCLKADRIMSSFSLFNIFDPDPITVVSVISTQYNFHCFLAMFFHLLEGLISCMYNRKPNKGNHVKLWRIFQNYAMNIWFFL